MKVAHVLVSRELVVTDSVEEITVRVVEGVLSGMVVPVTIHGELPISVAVSAAEASLEGTMKVLD